MFPTDSKFLRIYVSALLIAFQTPTLRPDPATAPAASTNLVAQPAEIPSENDTYVISNGDKLNYRVIEDRDDPRVLSVSPTGEIEVPYYGRFQVAGKTLAQAAADIRKALEKDLYNRATVLISVEDTARRAASLKPKQIFVVGQVRSQGAQELPADEKYMLSQAIVKAGGFSSFANGKRVQVIRKTPDGKGERLTVDVQAVFRDGKIENDIPLKPEDMIIVPEKLVNF